MPVGLFRNHLAQWLFSGGELGYELGDFGAEPASRHMGKNADKPSGQPQTYRWTIQKC